MELAVRRTRVEVFVVHAAHLRCLLHFGLGELVQSRFLRDQLYARVSECRAPHTRT